MYRTAFVPALIALFVAAFALEDRPDPARSTVAADVFVGARAMESLNSLAQTFPDRTPGSADDNRMADLVERTFKAPDETSGNTPFNVRRVVTPSRGRDLTTVVATRPGQSDRRIVLLANRDGAGLANLSGTAALLELSRVLKSREMRKTLRTRSLTVAASGLCQDLSASAVIG